MGERQAVGTRARGPQGARSACACRHTARRRNALFSAAFLLTATHSRLPRGVAAAETATVQYNRSM